MSFCLIGVCSLCCHRNSVLGINMQYKDFHTLNLLPRTCVFYCHHSLPCKYLVDDLLIFLLPSPWPAIQVIHHSLWVCIYSDLRPFIFPRSSSPCFHIHFIFPSPQPAPQLVLVASLLWWPRHLSMNGLNTWSWSSSQAREEYMIRCISKSYAH